jgi:uncharacterized protein YciU (UPF0263 family)
MTHQYARRTFDEAKELARLAFRSSVADNLTPEEITEVGSSGLLTGGTVGTGWEQIVGFIPDDHLYYELQIYKPSAEKPHIEKSFARMLVPRDRSLEVVSFMWRPSISA